MQLPVGRMMKMARGAVVTMKNAVGIWVSMDSFASAPGCHLSQLQVLSTPNTSDADKTIDSLILFQFEVIDSLTLF